MASIPGTEGMSHAEIAADIEQGGRFVVFPYAFSVLIMTFYRETKVQYIRAGEGTFGKALPYLALTALLSWWGFPWGPIRGIQALFHLLSGGRDVTDEVWR
jgi:hypothetical protein